MLRLANERGYEEEDRSGGRELTLMEGIRSKGEKEREENSSGPFSWWKRQGGGVNGCAKLGESRENKFSSFYDAKAGEI